MNDLDHSLGGKSTIPESQLGADKPKAQPPSDKKPEFEQVSRNFSHIETMLAIPQSCFYVAYYLRNKSDMFSGVSTSNLQKHINTKYHSKRLWPIYNWLVLWNSWIIFPFSWECRHPKWRTQIFQRGRAQPASSFCLQAILQDWPCSHSKAWESQVSGTRGIPRSNDNDKILIIIKGNNPIMAMND